MMKITIEIETPVSERVLTNLAAALAGKGIAATTAPEAPTAEPEQAKPAEAPKTTKTAKKEKKVEAEPTAPAVEETPAEEVQATKDEAEVTYTLEQVRDKLANLSRAGQRAEVKALLGEFGANKLSEVKEEDYAALMKKAEEL